MFGNLKTKGFNLEDTHLTNADKLSTLLALLALAVALPVKTGVAAARRRPIPIKKHAGRGSLFALGLSALRKIFAAANPPQISAFLAPTPFAKTSPQLIEIYGTLEGSLVRWSQRALWEKSRASIGSNGSAPTQRIPGKEDAREDFAERAAIMEFDGGLSRDEAEREAWGLVLNRHRLH